MRRRTGIGPARGRGGFTIVELLTVIAIISILFAMVGSTFTRTEARHQAVRVAAEELAATLRQARALAMQRKATHAVVFHLQNEPSSSGRVLNNRSGGHWYRILGPNANDGSLPAQADSPFGPYTLAQAAERTERAWEGESHVLTAGQVRFLALTDMDYGNYPPSYPYGPAGRRASAERSYPRPWFGWYDATSGRLHSWGGYDPAIPGSGFYFWGAGSKSSTANPVAWSPYRDPQPTDCTNPVERRLDHWITTSSWTQWRPPDDPQSVVLYEAGSPRPLICAAWRDVSLVFTATGEVRWGNFLPARHNRQLSDAYGTLARRGIGERCNGQSDWSDPSAGSVNQHTQTEAGNFDRSAGGWFITLAPDSPDDRDRFPDAKSALRSIMPMYRVFVSAFGEVRVIPVTRIPKFDGRSPFPGDESWWRTGSNTQAYFGQDRLVDGTVKASDNKTGVGDPVGRPITDFITPEMLIHRQVWMK